MIKILPILLFSLLVHLAMAQNPTYLLKITNEVQTSATTFEFDVFLLQTGSTPFELANLGFGIGIDVSVKNGGSLSAAIIAGSSDSGLTSHNQNPTNVSMSSVNSVSTTANCGSCNGTGITYNYMNVGPRSNPGAGNGFIISNVDSGCPSPGTKIGRFRLTNTANFTAGAKMNLVWSAIAASGQSNTVASAYVNGSATVVTVVASNINYNSPGNCASNPSLLSYPFITLISPSQMVAGIGDTLTIKGTGFESTRGADPNPLNNGNVIFRNADNGGATTIALDSIDFASWSDTLIKIILPSRVKAGLDYIPIGSASLRLINKSHILSNFSNLLNIPVSVNETITASGIKKRQYLSRYKCNTLLFYLGSNISGSASSIPIIDSALAHWSHYLDIDCRLARDNSGNLLYASIDSASNDTNVISFNTNIARMETKRWLPLTCNNIDFSHDCDILINPNVNWHYANNDTLPLGKADFYQAFLHQVGHALGLNHVIDSTFLDKQLMWYNCSDGIPTAPFDRTTLYTGNQQSALGALNHIVIPGKNLSNVNCANMLPLIGTAITNPVISATGTTVCNNVPVVLSSTNPGSAASLWSTGATTGTITVTSGGTYSLTLTLNGCSYTAPAITLSTLPLSTINSHPANDTACIGGTATFIVSAPSGSTYQWQHESNNIFVNISNTSNYSGTTTDTLTVNNAAYTLTKPKFRCMVTNGPAYCPTPGNSAELTVDSFSLAPFSSVYVNSPSFTLTGGFPPGGTYSSSGNNVTSGVYYPPATPAIDTIFYHLTGCYPDTVYQPIQVVNCIGTPCINVITTLYQGQICLDHNPTTIQVPFTALGIYGSQNIFTAEISNPVGNFSNPTAIGTLTSSRSNALDTIYCNIPSSFNPGSAYRIRVNSDSIATIGLASPYNIEILSSPCNQQWSDSDSLSTIEILLFPNPAFSSFTIHFPSISMFDQLQMVDMRGRLVMDIKIPPVKQFTVNVSLFADGLYIVKLNGPEQTAYKKISIIK